MNYEKDFKYVELAQGGVFNRGKLINIENLKNELITQNDVFLTYFRYNKDAVKYYQKYGRMKGFRGLLWTDFIAFDIDREKIEDACKNTLQLIDDIENKGISQELLNISFSGKKGFHVLLHSSIFDGFEPSTNLNNIHKKIAENLTNIKIDDSLYNTGSRLFRLAGSFHSEGKRYKTYINIDDLNYPEKILDKAKNKIEPIGLKRYSPIPKLVVLKEECQKNLNEKEKEYEVKSFQSLPKNQKKCIFKILQGVKEGLRNESCVRLIDHFKKEFFPYEVIESIIIGWNKRNLPPDNIENLLSTLNSVWKGVTDYGCNDSILRKYCQNDCFLFGKTHEGKEKESNIQIFSTIYDAQDRFKEALKRKDRVFLNIDPLTDKLSRGIGRGDLVAILGRPGTFKSTLAQKIASDFVTIYKQPFLFISLEMNLVRFFDRQAQVITGLTSDEIEKKYSKELFVEGYENLLISDYPSLSIYEIEKLVEKWQKQNDRKIEFICIDFLHKVKETGQEIERISKIVIDMKTLARKLDTRLIFLSHVSRSSGGEDGNMPLKLGSGRGTSTIEDNVDFEFGLYKPKDEDNVVIVQFLKNKNGITLVSGIKLYQIPGTVKLLNVDDDRYLSSSIPF